MLVLLWAHCIRWGALWYHVKYCLVQAQLNLAPRHLPVHSSCIDKNCSNAHIWSRKMNFQVQNHTGSGFCCFVCTLSSEGTAGAFTNLKKKKKAIMNLGFPLINYMRCFKSKWKIWKENKQHLRLLSSVKNKELHYVEISCQPFISGLQQ